MIFKIIEQFFVKTFFCLPQDLSLWINQSIKGIRGRNGQVVDNAHVLGLFNRICKLLFCKIKPVFVFDGKCPQLKQNTIAKRVEQRLKAISKSREASVKILHNYIASQLSSTSDQILTLNKSLPSLKSSELHLEDNKSFKIYQELNEIQRNQELSDGSEEIDSDSEPSIAQNYRNLQNFESIDVYSEDFKSLPPDIKYEILTEMKQKFKGYRNTELMPKETNDFSSYQLQRLLKKRQIQSKIEDTIKQLNGENSEDILQDWNKNNSYNENDLSAGRLMSDSSTRFIFLKKSQTNDSQNSSEEKSNKIPEDMSASSLPSIPNNSSDNSCLLISDSYDLEEIETKSSVDYKNTSKVSESTEQKSKLKSIFEKTIEMSDESDSEEVLDSKTCDNKTIENTFESEVMIDNKKETIVSNEFTKIKAIEVISDSDDEDFDEVLPQTEESLTKQINDITENDLNDKKNEINESIDIFDEFDVFFESNESKKELEEKFQTSSLTSISNSDDKSDEPKASTSKSVEFKEISREELLETCREVNKQNRFANHTTDQMIADCQELLSLFGIPYVMSPTEAEAQCAALEAMSLVDGTITDDSDILLFGAQTVYKNFFTSSKYVELFNANDIETRFGLTRSSLICIAMLCGSDYTDGVDGVGAVTATEILSEFRGEGLQPLIDLKNWWQNKQNSSDKRPENKIRAKLMKLNLSESFPNKVIFNAYMNPTVDTSTERFVWGMPRLDELRRYAALRFGWTIEKCDQILIPVMKKVNEKQVFLSFDLILTII